MPPSSPTLMNRIDLHRLESVTDSISSTCKRSMSKRVHAIRAYMFAGIEWDRNLVLDIQDM